MLITYIVDMNKNPFRNYFLLIIAIICSCGCNSSSEQSLPHIDLNTYEYSDSIKNIKITLNLPHDNIISPSEKKEFLKAVFKKEINNIDSILSITLSEHKNSSTDVNILYVDEKVISAKFTIRNWTYGGDTLTENSYISYLREPKAKLTLESIVNSPAEIDILTNMINQEDNSDIFLSPDVNISILGDSLSFHYNKLSPNGLKVSFDIDDIMDKFQKFKTTYND